MYAAQSGMHSCKQIKLIFTGRSAEAGLDLTLSVGVMSKPQMSHLETSNADSAQSKDVWNEI